MQPNGVKSQLSNTKQGVIYELQNVHGPSEWFQSNNRILEVINHSGKCYCMNFRSLLLFTSITGWMLLFQHDWIPCHGSRVWHSAGSVAPDKTLALILHLSQYSTSNSALSFLQTSLCSTFIVSALCLQNHLLASKQVFENLLWFTHCSVRCTERWKG